MDFSFINDIVQAILKLVPRPIIVRLTHGGIKWKLGKKAVEMKPGIHWVWPLVTEWELAVVARQTNHLPTQALITKDGKQVAVGALIVFSIRDIMQAIGERNWDVGTTINDISMAVIVEEITRLTFAELTEGLADRVARDLTAACRKHLRQFGVYVHRVRITEVASVSTLKILGYEKMGLHAPGTFN